MSIILDEVGGYLTQHHFLCSSDDFYLSRHVGDFNGHLLIVHRDAPFVRHFLRRSIFTQVASGQESYYNSC